MRTPLKFKPKPFLDAARRDWQFDAFAWLLRNCGGYPRFADTTLVRPTEEHFPDLGLRGHAAVLALFRRVREHAGMSEWPCAVEPGENAENPRLVATDRLPIIRYAPDPARPLSLGRYLVDTFPEAPPGGELLRDPAIDLAAVFMGFGLFMANAAFETPNHDLNEGELVHALAIFCILRKLPLESAEPHLNAHLRKYLRLAARDLAQHEPKFQRLRSVFPVIALDPSALAPVTA
jgi:hypothetical protein